MASSVSIRTAVHELANYVKISFTLPLGIYFFSDRMLLICSAQKHHYPDQAVPLKINLHAHNRLDPRTEKVVHIDQNGMPPSPRAFHNAAINEVKHVMYVYGGLNAAGGLADQKPVLHKFNLRLRQWTSVECIGDAPNPLSIAALACHKHGLLALVNPSKPIAQAMQVLRLDLKSCTWEAKLLGGKPPCIRTGACVTQLPKGFVLVYGGCDQSARALGDAHILDLEGMMWRQVALQPEALLPLVHCAGARSASGTLLFGGVKNMRSQPQACCQHISLQVAWRGVDTTYSDSGGCFRR